MNQPPKPPVEDTPARAAVAWVLTFLAVLLLIAVIGAVILGV